MGLRPEGRMTKHKYYTRAHIQVGIKTRMKRGRAKLPPRESKRKKKTRFMPQNLYRFRVVPYGYLITEDLAMYLAKYLAKSLTKKPSNS